MEQYSSGRRGVTRNLVGWVTGARVQIPAAPPKKFHPNWGGTFLMVRAKGFEHLNTTPRWGVACPRLDGDNTIIFFPLGRKCKQISAAPPTKMIREFERVTLLGKILCFLDAVRRTVDGKQNGS